MFVHAIHLAFNSRSIRFTSSHKSRKRDSCALIAPLIKQIILTIPRALPLYQTSRRAIFIRILRLSYYRWPAATRCDVRAQRQDSRMKETRANNYMYVVCARENSRSLDSPIFASVPTRLLISLNVLHAPLNAPWDISSLQSTPTRSS